MGRHLTHVGGYTPSGDPKPVNDQIKDRIGLNSMVCYKCNARNPHDADSCRKCGHENLRPKASEFRDA